MAESDNSDSAAGDQPGTASSLANQSNEQLLSNISFKNERQGMFIKSLVSIRQTDIFLSVALTRHFSLFLHEISLSLEISVHKTLGLFNF